MYKEIEKNGLKFITREGTLDSYIVSEVWAYDKHLTINNNDTILDAGGNIGAFAVMAASKGAKVLSFEPDPENYEIFKKNIEINNLTHLVEVRNAALTPENGKLNLYLNGKKNKGSHSLTKRRGREFIEVECVSWFEIGSSFNKAKIDIEGSEYELIENCLDSILHIEKGVLELHINGFGVEKYLKAIELLKMGFPNGIYDNEPKKKWHTLAKI